MAPEGAASSISRPRMRTVRSPSAKLLAPETTSAAYSPSEWPAAAAGSRPFSIKSRATATLVARSAGCVLTVRVSSSSGPSKHNVERGNPRTRSASSNVSRTISYSAASSRPMPTLCEPCPGKTQTSLRTGASLPRPLDHPGGPGQPAAETDEHDDVPILHAPGRNRLVQRDGDGGGRRVAVPFHVAEDAILGEPQPLGSRIDDPDVGLMRDEESDVLGRDPRAPQRFQRGFGHHADGELKHLAPLHLDKGGRRAVPAHRDGQFVAAGAVGAQVCGEDAPALYGT